MSGDRGGAGAPGLDVAAVRAQFPALARREGGQPVIYFDGPAGSQVPQRVIDRMADYLAHHNANTHGLFATSRETDQILEGGRAALADFLGASDPDCVVFGQSATSLAFQLSRSLARTWKPGDRVVVTQLDHDANVTPWVMAAADAGAQVRTVKLAAGGGLAPLRSAWGEGALDMDDLAAALEGGRTRLCAVTAASNATGTLPPLARIAEMVRAAGAELAVDAVHYAPHRLPDVTAWDCDYAVCSTYKFFGPHMGVLWGRREHLAGLPAYQVRPADDVPPWRWMTGTASHEGIAGAAAAVEYIEELGAGAGAEATRRARLVEAYRLIGAHETALCRRLLAGLAENPAVQVWGIADPDRAAERAPTVAFTHARKSPAEIAAYLGERGVYVWHGNYYALELSRALGREPDGMVRVGLLHYNTAGEVDRLLSLLRELGE